MNKGIKYLISGKASSGKTSLISKIDKGFVIAVDSKTFSFNIPHYKANKFNGVVAFKKELVSKIQKYKDKNGELPKTVVIDTITHLYQDMHTWSMNNYKGFEVFNQMQTAVIQFNSMLEHLLIAKGINVVITAHTTMNNQTMAIEIPAMGAFKDSGGWLSYVDYASYLTVENNKRVIHHNTLKYPTRTLIDVVAFEDVDSFDINDYINKVEVRMNEVVDNEY